MQLLQSTAARIPIRLMDNTGAPVVAVLPTAIGVSSIVKSTGTITDIVLVNATNWFEVSAAKFPGLYHLLLTTAHTDTLGTFQVSIQPTVAQFVGVVGSFTVVSATTTDSIKAVVDAIRADYTTVRAVKLDNLDATISSRASAANLTSLQANITDLYDAAFGKWEIKVSGIDANRLIMYKADGFTVLKKFDLKDATGAATFIDPFSRTPI